VDKSGQAGDASFVVHLTQIEIAHGRFPTRDAYPFSLRLFQETVGLTLDAPVTFFVGENGSGKSTLLRALAHRCDIHIWENTERSRASHNAHAERLCECLDLRWTHGPVAGSFFAADLFRGFAERLDAWAASDPGLYGYFGGTPLTEQSHGQCNMAFFENRFRVPGLYLLDEPESGLSPRRQLELRQILDAAGRSGHAQFIVATHSPLLLALPGSRVFSFDECPVGRVDYRDTALFRLYRTFLQEQAD
jgi:predicted ATPase